METKDALNALSALAHDTRLAVFRRLVAVGHDGISVGALRDELGLAGPTLTAHLNQLRHADLVHDVRDGRVIRVRAHYARMHALIVYLFDQCCVQPASGEKPDLTKPDLASALSCCVPPTHDKQRSTS